MAESVPHYKRPIEPQLHTREAWQNEVAGRNRMGSNTWSNLMEPLTFGKIFMTRVWH